MQPAHDQALTMRWMWYGLGAMFVLIGVAVLLAVVYNRTPTQVTSPTNFDSNWVWGLAGLFFAVWFFSWMFRWGGGWGWRYRYRRWYGGDEYDILRERYAKGELTREQFEQTMADLKRHDT